MTVYLEPEGGVQGILDCRVDSEPLASLTIHLGSRLVASSQPQVAPAKPHIHVSATPNALRVDIGELRPGDQGEYVCSASNALGSASAATYFGTRGEGGSISQATLRRGPVLRSKGFLLRSFLNHFCCNQLV